ncbi:O-antigen ligase family protein [Flavobacterium ponti]|uniref:O-antigen ligase family protein n=1 Tax=Flavobacterium ponti TaxID=665133 RepID=A0ABV9P4D9_9FLAO
MVIVKKKNQNNEALIFAGYIVASEVFFRMTHGVPNNEFGKYSVIIFLLVGLYFSGLSKKSFIYWLFILFLIPGVFIGISALNFEINIRKAIAFNLSGPVCLAISAIYAYQRKVTKKEMEFLITSMILPIVSMVTYMYLYTPSNRNIFMGTESNFETSGGFGPNQVSTIIGLGMFLVFIRLVLYTKEKRYYFINIILLAYISYRGILTFSRGGVYTGIIMIALSLFSMYLISNLKGRFKINIIFIVSIFAGILIFIYSSIQTGGMINKRYAGEDALGREKSSKFSGREKLVESELVMFLDNPITGVGVGVNKQFREELTGIESASHNEISRMLAEHGVLGVINLLILLLMPIFLFLNNRQNIFLFSFYMFWLLTINHAAMRIAAPAFIYALSLLNFTLNEETTLHRE